MWEVHEELGTPYQGLTRRSRDRIMSMTQGLPHLRASSTRDYRESLTKIAHYIVNAFGADDCSIFLEREPGKYTLEATTSRSLSSARWRSAYYQRGEGLTGWVAKHARGLRIGDVHDTAELRSVASDLRWFAKYVEVPRPRTGPFLAVPIIVHKYVLGVIRVVGRDRPFSEDEEERLIELSDELAKQLRLCPHLLRSVPTLGKKPRRTHGRIETVREATKRRIRARVFISYAHSDRPKAKRLVQELRKAGASVLFDEWELKAGDSLLDRIDQALSTSDYLLVLLSPHSVRSNWVRREWGKAFENEISARAITVIPILIADCKVPTRLATRQVLDLRGDFDAGVRWLAEQLSLSPQLDLGSMSERQLSALVQDILVALGFRDVRSPQGAFERGYDIEASLRTCDPFSTEDERWLVEIKSYKSGRADLKSISQMFHLIDILPHEAKGLIVTNSQLTSAARAWLESAVQGRRRQVRILDGTDLKEILLRHPDIARRHLR